MRKYVLTDVERNIIKRFLENGERLEGYAMLLTRIRNMQTINSDLELIKKFLSKVEGKQPWQLT